MCKTCIDRICIDIYIYIYIYIYYRNYPKFTNIIALPYLINILSTLMSDISTLITNIYI